MKEEWKDIEGYEGLYRVSNTGKVLSVRRNREFSLNPNPLYVNVSLSKEGDSKSFSVHRLVAKAFVPNPENKTDVNHIDGNKLNNNSWNLEWTTKSENIKHALKLGLKTLDFKDVVKRKVDRISLTDEVIQTYESLSEAARDIKGQVSLIHQCCNGRQNTHRNFKWKYHHE